MSTSSVLREDPPSPARQPQRPGPAHVPHALTSELDAHILTPTAINAASTHAVRTSTLSPTSCAVPYACAISNALVYVRPCRRRIPKALPTRTTSTVGPEIIAKKTAKGRTTPTGMLIANSRKITIATPKPTASAGNPLDLSSNHTCALVADEVGHGNRNRLTSQSGYPPIPPAEARSRASPRRCRATPATVSAIETTPIRNINAYSASENSTPAATSHDSSSRKKAGKVMTVDPIHWTTLLRVDHWMQV